MNDRIMDPHVYALCALTLYMCTYTVISTVAGFTPEGSAAYIEPNYRHGR